jgi:general stress protein YciG
MSMNGTRGFGNMNPDKQREIASKGGKRAHTIGRAHQFTHDEAVAAGRLGGLSRSAKKRAAAQVNAIKRAV